MRIRTTGRRLFLSAIGDSRDWQVCSLSGFAPLRLCVESARAKAQIRKTAKSQSQNRVEKALPL